MNKNYINGEFKEPINGKYIESWNPATAKVNAKVPNSTKEDVDLAVKAATTAFKTWSKTTRKQRQKIMLKIADLVESRQEEFAMAESNDQGKTFSFASSVDIPRVIDNFRFFANSVMFQDGKSADIDGVGHSFVIKEPVGVVFIQLSIGCIDISLEFTSLSTHLEDRALHRLWLYLCM
jgi:aminomuconate-semialdehyde/2-hydroxymuconate-6-semialdehyde dehydrogenase